MQHARRYCVQMVLAGWVALVLGGSLSAADFTVTSTADSGPGSLRQAMIDAMANSSIPHRIRFNIPTSDTNFDGTTFTIRLASALPVIRNGLTLDARTQTEFSGDTNPVGPEVVISASLLSPGTVGCFQISGDNNVIQGFVINGGFNGAVWISYTPYDTTPSGNQILDNYCGTDASGLNALPNNAGIGVGGYGSPSLQAADNTIDNNLVSGNTGVAIVLCDARHTQITRNRIGVNRIGTPLGNGGGILIACAGSPSNIIERNIIAHNAGDAIRDEPDYRYPVAYTPDGHQRNHFFHNWIYANSGLGINLIPPSGEAASTPTLNDVGDTDTGGNLLQNFPVITQAETDGIHTLIEGTLNSTPNTTFEVELFSNTILYPSGYGQGENYLTTISVTTNAEGNAVFSVDIPSFIPAGQTISATASDGNGNTSEFSRAFAVSGKLDFDINHDGRIDAVDLVLLNSKLCGIIE